MSEGLFTTDTVSQDDCQSSGIVNKEGWYHFQIADVKPELNPLNADGNERAPHFVIKAVVVGSSEGQSPAGTMLFHRLFVGKKGGGPPAEGAIKSNIRFLTGVGAMKWSKVGEKMVAVDIDTGKAMVTLDTVNRCKGLQFMADIKLEPGTEGYKDKYVIQFGEVFQPGDPKVKGVPFNEEVWAAKDEVTEAEAGLGDDF